MLWFELPIVEQGSQSGVFQSSVAGRRRQLRLKQIDWSLVKHWRRLFGHTARSKQPAKPGKTLQAVQETADMRPQSSEGQR